MNIDALFKINPYSLGKKEKSKLLSNYLAELTRHHYMKSVHYKTMVDALNFDVNSEVTYTELPFLPVRLFKLNDLSSIADKDIFKTMTSSGTSGQQVSKIFLDKETSLRQTKVLTKIVSEFIRPTRSPMIILDSMCVLKDRNMFSARGAGILGFSMFGTKRVYALNENMELDIESLNAFVKDHQESRIFIFGFTFMIYKHFIKELQKKKIKLDLSNAVLIHGGGWKKLESQSISSVEFKKVLNNLTGIKSVFDYYGMVEQTGAICMECEYGHLHTSIFSDIIIRRPYDFSVAEIGEIGIIQTVSILPKSYPGHSLLTEDEGILLGEDDCQCGRLGKYFKVIGRLNNAEIRGCSDTYAS